MRTQHPTGLSHTDFSAPDQACSHACPVAPLSLVVSPVPSLVLSPVLSLPNGLSTGLSNGSGPRNSVPKPRNRVPTTLVRAPRLPCRRPIPYSLCPTANDRRPACGGSFTLAMALDFARTSVLPSPYNAPKQPTARRERPFAASCSPCDSAQFLPNCSIKSHRLAHRTAPGVNSPSYEMRKTARFGALSATSSLQYGPHV